MRTLYILVERDILRRWSVEAVPHIHVIMTNSCLGPHPRCRLRPLAGSADVLNVILSVALRFDKVSHSFLCSPMTAETIFSVPP
jgi:hypothetical protein